ncbi:hypothetical protein OFC55_40705, partial [Escherichia coli]|nr:hypothetical protein [Escherichia coli]
EHRKSTVWKLIGLADCTGTVLSSYLGIPLSLYALNDHSAIATFFLSGSIFQADDLAHYE